MVIVINSVIGSFNCLITGVQLQSTAQLHCDFNCTEWLGKNKVANAPITFEEMQRL